MNIDPWKLHHIWTARHTYLAQCTTDFERINVMAMVRLEIKELAAEIKKTRKLTPGEQSILDNGT